MNSLQTSNAEYDEHTRADLLLDGPSRFQRLLHWGDGQNHVSYYGHHIKAIAFSVLTWRPLERSSKDENNRHLSFKIDKRFDLLRGVYLQFTTPALEVKPGYSSNVRIAWKRKLAHFALEKATIMIDGVPGPSLDSHILNIIEQYYIHAGHQDNYATEIGNLPELTALSTRLPRHTYTLWLPFFFFWDPALAMHLFRCQGSDITIDIMFKSEIRELLLYEEDVYDDQNNLKKTKRTVHYDRLNGLGVNTTEHRITPLMRARYVKLLPEEKKEIISSSPNYMNIPTFVPIDTRMKNLTKLGEECNFAINTKFVMKALFWMTEGYENVKLGIFGNYTDNKDHKQGVNPCYAVDLNYDKQPVLNNFAAEHFSRIESHFFPAAPREIGYNAFTFSENQFMVDVEPSISPMEKDIQASMKIVLKVVDRYRIMDEDDDEPPLKEGQIDQFYIIARALIQRRINYDIKEFGDKDAKARYPALEKIIDPKS